MLELNVAPVDATKNYVGIKDLWSRNLYGLDYSPIQRLALNNPSLAEFRSENLLGKQQRIAHLDFAKIEEDELQGQGTWKIHKEGILHGIAGWFAVQLSPGIRFSNYPAHQNSCWEHTFFPIEQPIEVKVGDKIQVAMRVSENVNLYQWQVEVFRQGEMDGDTPSQVIKFDHGGIKGIPYIDEWVDRFLNFKRG
jgi:hypothetical protein